MERITQAVAVTAGRPVRVGYLDHHGPDVTAAATELVAAGAPSVVTVPLLLSEAFHRKVDVPAAVAAARDALGVDIELTSAIGPDPALLTAAHRRLREAGGSGGGVVLAYAGTTDAAAAAAVQRLARRWEARWGTPTRVAHAGATGPDLADAVASLRADGVEQVEVASWFLAPGRLSERVEREAVEAGVRVVAEPLGAAPEVVSAILARAVATRARRAA
jgi:sirohydrochlorin ferrochelatase